MPIIRKIMKNLAAQYGKKKGKNVYYALEAEGKLDKAKKTVAGRK